MLLLIVCRLIFYSIAIMDDVSDFDEIRKRFGYRIRELREAKGWSQERLADDAEIHRTYLGGIERGLRNPSLRNITKIAEALEISISAIFDYDNNNGTRGSDGK